MDKTKIVESYKRIIGKYDALKKWFMYLFLVLLAVYVFGFIVQTTMFDVYFGGTLSSYALKFMFLTAGVRIFFSLEHTKDLIFAGALSVLLYACYQFKPDSFLTFLGVMAFNCLGIEYRRILKIQVYVIGMTVLVAVVAALTGTIDNLVYLKDRTMIRDSFGICYPTDFASYLFYAFIFFWIAWKKIPGWVSIMISVPFMVIVHWYALSDTCTICGIAFILVLMIQPFVERYLVERGNLPTLKKFVNLLLVLAFPLFAMMMFLLIAWYAKEVASGRQGFASDVNRMITGRLALAYQAFENYGITLWGSSLKQQGNGAITFDVVGYDFVDSSYPLMLLRNGLIVFILIAFLWMRLVYRAIKAKDYRLAFGMGLITLHSFIEHHFPEAYYNILLFLSCAMISCEKENKKEEMVPGEKPVEKTMGYQLRIGGSIGLILCVFILAVPWYLANLRTICGKCRLTGDTNEGFIVIISVITMVSSIVFLCLGVLGVWRRRFRMTEKSYAVPCLALGSFFAISGSIFLILLTRDACKQAEELWKKDNEILVSLDRENSGRIYSTEFPVFYKKHLKNLKYGILTGEDLARKNHVTLIVPRGTEYYVMFEKGFQYTAISESTAIYSNDLKTNTCLQEHGFEPLPYCDEVRYVELPTNTAPLVNLRKGRYTVNYRFHVTKGDGDPENVAKLMIVGNKGYTIITNQLVPVSKLDENEEVEYTIQIDLEQDMPGMMFYILGEENCQIEVKEVSYQMTPQSIWNEQGNEK